ncbi:xylulokinase [Pasteurellaceae bacterium 22721_9_1]
MENIATYINSGQAVLGIEFGSTRIKAVLINQEGNILESSEVNWESKLDNGIWTYSQNDILNGLQTVYTNLSQKIKNQYQITLKKLSAIGISAMMHGYLPFNQNGELLVPFRTWQNNITSESSKQLTTLFNYNIPQRWSISHLYQAVLNKEEHLSQIHFFTTLAGYVHWKLTDKKVLGIGDASGMFPVNTEYADYDKSMLLQFNDLISKHSYSWGLEEILPKILVAGENAGFLTEEGAKLLDPTGNLQPNIPFCPPEGDAGTGMIATNSILEGTGNISAGTSAFAMIVLEKGLSRVYEKLDLVTTPEGKLVAMAHANNCTSNINSWINIFHETLNAFELNIPKNTLYETLFNLALKADPNGGGLLSYGFYTGEHLLNLTKGCPIFIHPSNAQFNLPNFILTHLYSAFAVMKLGVDILLKQEQVKINRIVGHGGIFKTPGVAQKILSSALNIPIATMETAGEGGAWGIALLANYLGNKMSLNEYLQNIIFSNTYTNIIKPEPSLVEGYEQFIQHYQSGIDIAQTAATQIH